MPIFIFEPGFEPRKKLGRAFQNQARAFPSPEFYIASKNLGPGLRAQAQARSTSSSVLLYILFEAGTSHKCSRLQASSGFEYRTWFWLKPKICWLSCLDFSTLTCYYNKNHFRSSLEYRTFSGIKNIEPG